MSKLKKKPLLFLVLSLLFISIGTTFALFQTGYIYENMFQSSKQDVVLVEESSEMVWSSEATSKKVSVANNGDSDVVIRVSYDEVWSKEVSDEVVQISNIVDGEEVVIKNWTSTFLTDFELKDDGWYYYKKVLKGNTTVQLLESILLDSSLPIDGNVLGYEDYYSYNYELSFHFEAVQATKNAISKVWGYTVEITEDDVTW